MNYLFLIIVIAVVLVVLAIASFTSFGLDDFHYDRLKWVVIRWSFLVTFIGLIVKTFNIEYGTETVTLVAGVGAMLAGLLGISNTNYMGEKMTDMFNEDLLKDMLGFETDLYEMGELECEEEVEESEESED